MLTKDLSQIFSELANNEIVSLPTDTVYGLSCRISNNAVQKIIELKKRELDKGFIIISHDYSQLLKFVDKTKLSNDQIKKICSIQKNPTTWIVPSKKSIQWLTGGKPTVAIRLVRTDIIKKICLEIDSAIISTSANISGEEFINNAKAINNKFPNIYVLNTEVQLAQPSKIINIITDERIR